MAYQRTEYADKTLSMNSLADRKLKIQLDSLNCHKGSIGKEIDREKKKIKKELAEAGEYMKNRLSVNEIPSDKRLSPRLPRRLSTPSATLLATLPVRSVSDVGRRSPNATRRLSGSEALMLESVASREPTFAEGPVSPRSPTSPFLKPPFNQPRRQSLPPISSGSLMDTREYSARPRSPSGTRSPSSGSGALTPRCPSRRGSAAMHETAQMVEVASKVNRFLQKLDHNKNEQSVVVKTGMQSATDQEKEYDSDGDRSLEAYQGNEDLVRNQTIKRSSSTGLFQPANFE